MLIALICCNILCSVLIFIQWLCLSGAYTSPDKNVSLAYIDIRYLLYVEHTPI